MHEHYDQYYNGIKVDEAGYNFHFEKSKMYLAHGNFIEIGIKKIRLNLSKKP